MRKSALSYLAVFLACAAISCGKPHSSQLPPKANAQTSIGLTFQESGTLTLSAQVSHDNALNVALITPSTKSGAVTLEPNPNRVTFTFANGTIVVPRVSTAALPPPVTIITPGLPQPMSIKSF